MRKSSTLLALVSALLLGVVSSTYVDQTPEGLGFGTLEFDDLDTEVFSPFSSLHKRAVCTQPRNCRGRRPLPAHAHYVCRRGGCHTICNAGFKAVAGKCQPRTCKVANCHQTIPLHAKRVCTPKRTCGFVCDAGHRFNGKTCAVGTSSCKKSHCTGPIPVHSHHICKAGACSFGCNSGFHPEAGACVVDKTTCSSSADCARSHPKHSHVFCNKGTCGIRCNAGFMLSNANKCVPNNNKCGAAACDSIHNGQVTCSPKGTCHYTCDTSSGYHLKVIGGVSQCINFSTDVHNCGKIGKTCAPDYLGHGKPRCTQGNCTLKCPTGQTAHTSPTSPPFCA